MYISSLRQNVELRLTRIVQVLFPRKINQNSQNPSTDLRNCYHGLENLLVAPDKIILGDFRNQLTKFWAQEGLIRKGLALCPNYTDPCF
jgi:hypothetical protein